MFLRLTSGDNRKFMLNPSFIVEILNSDGTDENINSVLFTPFHDKNGAPRAFEVQETIDEIQFQIKDMKK